MGVTRLGRLIEKDRANAHACSMFVPANSFYNVLTTAGTGSTALATLVTGTDPATEACMTVTIGHTTGVFDMAIPIYGSMFSSAETADAAKGEVARGAKIVSVGPKLKIATTALTTATATIQLIGSATGAISGTAVSFTGSVDTATTANPTIHTLTITNGVTLVSGNYLLVRVHMTQTAGAVTALSIYGASVVYNVLL